MKIPTKFVKSLSSEEIKELEEINKNHPSRRVRTRAHSILLSSEHYSIKDICKIFKVHCHSVSSWIKSWENDGDKSLEDKPRPGGKPKLTESERKIAEDLIKKYPKSLKMVIANLFELTGKTISVSTLKRIAKATNLRWKRAKKTLKAKRDPKEFVKAQEEIEELKKKKKPEKSTCGILMEPVFL